MEGGLMAFIVKGKFIRLMYLFEKKYVESYVVWHIYWVRFLESRIL